MRRLLFATAAASALMFAPLWAAAQGTYGSDTPGATPNMSSPAMPATSTPTPYAADTTTGGATSSDVTTGTTADAQTQGSYAGSQPNTAMGASSADTAAANPNAYGAAPPANTYGADTTNEATTTAASTGASSLELTALVQDMGLSAVPMTAQDVCAPRTVSLDRSNGMTRDQKVRFAVDYASTCKTQGVVIHAPRSQQARLTRIVEDHGVPADMITTETASASDASVQMNFAGLATSSAEYAALFNPQYASNAGYSATSSDVSNYSAPSAAAPTTGVGTQPESGAPQGPTASPPYDAQPSATDTPSASSDMGGSTTNSTPTSPSTQSY